MRTRHPGVLALAGFVFPVTPVSPICNSNDFDIPPVFINRIQDILPGVISRGIARGNLNMHSRKYAEPAPSFDTAENRSRVQLCHLAHM